MPPAIITALIVFGVTYLIGYLISIDHGRTLRRLGRDPYQLELDARRDEFFELCLQAAKAGKFKHVRSLYIHVDTEALEYGNEVSLTDESWPYGVQPYHPLNLWDNLRFTKAQSKALQDVLTKGDNAHTRLIADLDRAKRILTGGEE